MAVGKAAAFLLDSNRIMGARSQLLAGLDLLAYIGKVWHVGYFAERRRGPGVTG